MENPSHPKGQRETQVKVMKLEEWKKMLQQECQRIALMKRETMKTPEKVLEDQGRVRSGNLIKDTMSLVNKDHQEIRKTLETAKIHLHKEKLGKDLDNHLKDSSMIKEIEWEERKTREEGLDSHPEEVMEGLVETGMKRGLCQAENTAEKTSNLEVQGKKEINQEQANLSQGMGIK